MLSIYQSHHVDELFAHLCQFLHTKSHHPFQPLTVLVPSLAIGRWLTYEWANIFGICAHVDMPYPAEFMWECFGKIVPETPKSAILGQKAMHWRLFEALAHLPNEPIYQILHRYLERAPQPIVGRWQLAGRIAQVFGDYRTYRRDWLAAWHQGKLIEQKDKPFRHQEWQAALWQQLFAEEHHQQGHLLLKFQTALQQQPHLVRLLPSRLAVFTTVRLPPNELEFFRVLSQFIEVQFYHLNPSSQYWADIVDERWLSKMKARYPQRMMALYETGHPLLTAWGKQLRDTFKLLSELSGGEQENDWQDNFPSIETPHLLAELQHSIHEMVHQDREEWHLEDKDNSIQIHSCHSLTRQLEVLHDQLLTLFATATPRLKPQDVVVMLPDIASASGAIEAVFGTVPENRRIPWQLTGVASPEENSLWRAFTSLYQLSQGRLTQAEFIDWLSLAPVSSYYQLVADDIEQCTLLLEKAAVYRCLDGQHRAEMTGDASDTDDVHTFLFGLERLLLGTVLPPDYQQTYAGVQAVANIEADSFALIGTLTQAVSDLAERRTWLQQRQTAQEGVNRLEQDLQRFFVAQVGTRAWDTLQQAFVDLRETLQAAPIQETVSLSLLLQDLEQRITASAPGAVPGGVVHFSRLGALRLLPYRVVCILGLEDTAYPRREIINEFDLLAQDSHPRAGDRSRRDDDKGIFLEALMSAKDHLLLFYNGASNSHATTFPPSTLISQLVDYLGRRVIGGKKRVEEKCWHKHRLQPFSPVYFTQPQDTPQANSLQLSYAQEWLPAAQAVLTLSSTESRFVDTDLPLANHLQQTSLETLNRFYQHPAKYFLSQQLKIYIRELDEQTPDEEPLHLDNLAKWHLRQQCLADGDVPLVQLRASGQLPVGTIGEVYCQQTEDAVQPLKEALNQYYRPVVLERVLLLNHQLNASLPPVSEPYQLGYKTSKRSAKHLLQAWLNHLAWQAHGANKKTIWLFMDEAQVFLPIPRLQAEDYLQQWWQYYQQGLTKPLLLPANVAFKFAETTHNPKKGADEASLAAQQEWASLFSSDLAFGRKTESKDVYWLQITPETQRQQLPIEITQLAPLLYLPLVEYSKKVAWSALAQEFNSHGN
jgi:exodeoxyribonuclease V gamma subunit